MIHAILLPYYYNITIKHIFQVYARLSFPLSLLLSCRRRRGLYIINEMRCLSKHKLTHSRNRSMYWLLVLPCALCRSDFSSVFVVLCLLYAFRYTYTWRVSRTSKCDKSTTNGRGKPTKKRNEQQTKREKNSPLRGKKRTHWGLRIKGNIGTAAEQPKNIRQRRWTKEKKTYKWIHEKTTMTNKNERGRERRRKMRKKIPN